jgi:CxxC-x17-CxxC domain-containing protein
MATVEEAPAETVAASTGGRRDDSQRSRRNRPESNGNRSESSGNRKEAATVEVDADGNRWDYDSRVERDRRRQSHNGIRPIAPTLYSSRAAAAGTPSNDRPRRDPQAPRPQRTEPGQQSNGNGNNNRRTSSNGDGTGERHDIECAACGITTSVPFKPDSGRPVYCRDCYNAMRPEGTTGNRNRSSRNGQSQESRQVQPA